MKQTRQPPVRRSLGLVLLLTSLLTVPLTLKSDTLQIAVAANFRPTLLRVITALERQSPHRYKIIAGSTGTLYAQIVNGAPYDVFLAADDARPRLLEEARLIEPGSRRTYAVGQLALWWPGSKGALSRDSLVNLRGTLAIANPDIAPYGRAAMEVISSSGAHDYRLITGVNVAQVYHFIASGNANAGFVALSLIRDAAPANNTFWVVDQNLYSAIEQQSVILKSSQLATDFDRFLRNETTWKLLAKDGYHVPGNPAGGVSE